MNKLFYTLSLFAIVLLFPQCEEPLQYKYADKPFTINCTSEDNVLIKEALYSFQSDIATYFNDPDLIPGSTSAQVYAYRNFIFKGLDGSLPYGDIASPHTWEILKRLKEVPGLWDRNRKGTNLDYNGEFMKCIFNNIKDDAVKTHINSLLQVDYLTPRVMAEPMRQQVAKAFSDEHLALYIALDGYYQYLLDIEAPTND